MIKRKNRSQMIVRSDLQIFFIRYGLTFSIVSSLCFWGVQELFFYKMTSKAKAIGLDVNHPFFELIQSQKSVLSPLMIGSALLISVVMVWYGIYLSHRIAGPIKKIENHLDKCLSGEPVSELNFRKDDFFAEIGRKLNLLIEKKRIEP